MPPAPSTFIAGAADKELGVFLPRVVYEVCRLTAVGPRGVEKAIASFQSW